MNDFHLYDLFNIITLINHFKNKYQLLVTENSVSAVCSIASFVKLTLVQPAYDTCPNTNSLTITLLAKNG